MKRQNSVLAWASVFVIAWLLMPRPSWTGAQETPAENAVSALARDCSVSQWANRVLRSIDEAAVCLRRRSENVRDGCGGRHAWAAAEVGATDGALTAMFSLQQITSAVAKVRTGADYPRLVQELKNLGIRRYEHFVADGTNVYHGDGGHAVRVDHPQEVIPVADVSSAEKLQHALAIHQRGETTYPMFCEQAGAAGVATWVSDLAAMTVSYIDKAGKVIVVERIPPAG